VDPSKVNIVTVGFAPMPLLLSHRIDGLGDAITWSEPAMYNVQIGKPADDKSTYAYFAFYQNGLPRYYTLGVVAAEDTMKNNPELAQRFLRAWVKGLDWAIHNQQASMECGDTRPKSMKRKPSPTTPRLRVSPKVRTPRPVAWVGRIWQFGRSRRSSCASMA
jgi:ABC-type nitrate/sulfonate/bicarbonate transport system substrate-binding protein